MRNRKDHIHDLLEDLSLLQDEFPTLMNGTSI